MSILTILSLITTLRPVLVEAWPHIQALIALWKKHKSTIDGMTPGFGASEEDAAAFASCEEMCLEAGISTEEVQAVFAK